jgi:hypothetical protein
MKKLFFILSICLLFVSGNAFASFPVESLKKINKTETHDTELSKGDDIQISLKSKKEVKKQIKEIKKTNKDTSRIDEDLVITLVLWFVLGVFAAHRWYKRKPAIWNILFILTLGGFGIWWIVDLVHILQGDF